MKNIAFISTRIHGTDGVSLEINKWADILSGMGHNCFYVAGESDKPAESTFIIPECHFNHSEVLSIQNNCFGCQIRGRDLSNKIINLTATIKDKLYDAIEKFAIDIIIAENCVTIPMNIPLGLALVELVMETGVPTIAHHHDFYWERDRFLLNSVEDHLATAFPPPLSHIKHVVINSIAANDFCRRTGLTCQVIPNIMDFDTPPEQTDDYAQSFRKDLGLSEEDKIILQPTRIVPRKAIEHSIELIHHLKDSSYKLVITHQGGDEGHDYTARIKEYSKLLNVDTIFADSYIDDTRSIKKDGSKIYTIWDAYSQADLITYPSSYEGFGNAFLEAIYYRKPILCNRYAIYRTDIEPCGFDVVLMDGFITEKVVNRVKLLLSDNKAIKRMTDRNFDIAKEFFSYQRAKVSLEAMLVEPTIQIVCSIN